MRRAHLSILWRYCAGGSGAGAARGILRAWQWWERLARAVWPAQPIPGAEDGILRMRFATYSGSPFQLPDGTMVRAGDLVGEMHLDNLALVRTAADSKWNTVVRMKSDLAALAHWSTAADFPADVRAIWGLSLLSRASAILGFTVRRPPMSLRLRFERVYMSGLLRIYTVEGIERLQRGSTTDRYPHELWMSLGELRRRYGG